MKRLQAVSVLLFVFFSSLLAQQFLDRDSLINLLNTSEQDTNRVLLYISIGQQFENNHPDSAIYYYRLARDLSEELDYVTGTMKYLSNITYVYNAQGLYDSSLVLTLEALKLAEKYGTTMQKAACLGNVGNTYLYLEHYELAVDYMLRAMELIRDGDNPQYLTIMYNNLAIVYMKLKQADRAREFAEQGVELAREINDPINLSISLDNLALAAIESYRPMDAVRYLTEALEIAEETDNIYLKESVLLHFVDAYLQTGQFDKVRPFAEEGLRMATDFDDRAGMAGAIIGLSYYYLYHGQTGTALTRARDAEKIAHDSQLTEQLRRVYSLLSEISLASGDFEGYRLYSFRHDSLENKYINEMLLRNVQELETRYETDKQARQISQLEQEKEVQKLKIRQDRLILLTLIGFTFTIIIVSFFLVRSNRQKQLLYRREKELKETRIKEMEAEQHLLVTKAVLEGQEEERARLSRDLHDGLGGMLSGIRLSLNNLMEVLARKKEDIQLCERSMDMLDGSIRELRTIAHNLMPESLIKFGLDTSVNDLCERVNSNASIQVNYQSVGMDAYHADNEVIITIYRIIQELINNILKHASAKNIYVQMVSQDSELEVTVEDDGIGFNVKDLENSTGIGWKNIQNRVDYLRGKVDIRSETGKGTTVILHI